MLRVARLAAQPLGCSIIAVSRVECQEGPEDAPGVTSSLPVYTRKEVSKHVTREAGVWTTFGNGVYDMTGFIDNHPGGSDKVVLAAGGKLESYWNLYRQHYSSAAPKQHLAKMCIGRLHPDDLKSDLASVKDLTDPFSMDPEVSPVVRCFVKKPVNAEPPGPLLTHSFLTPNDIFFIRNHHPVPQKLASVNFKIDESKYIFTVKISGKQDGSRSAKEVSISLADLKSKFPCREVIASLQCGGNRREELSNIEMTAGTPWKIGAIATARWEGALLSDVLKYAGIKEACQR
jgi:sulfite oxidase